MTFRKVGKRTYASVEAPSEGVEYRVCGGKNCARKKGKSPKSSLVGRRNRPQVEGHEDKTCSCISPQKASEASSGVASQVISSSAVSSSAESKASDEERQSQTAGASVSSCLDITPEMLEAGVHAYWDACMFNSYDETHEVHIEIVRKIYLAMSSVRERLSC
jgi:hypothetical protein